MMFAFVIGCFVLSIISIFRWTVSTFDYWKIRNVPYVKPIPLFGNLLPFASRRENYTDMLIRIYKELSGKPYGGYFEMREPILMVRDPKLIGLISIRHFDHFHDRDVTMIYTPDSKRLNPLSVNLFAIKGQRWQRLRQKLSPTFTTNKLYAMSEQVESCTSVLIERLQSADNGDLEIKQLIMNYIIGVVGACAMGIDCASMTEHEKATFVRMANKTFIDADYSLKFLLMTIHPKLVSLFRIPDIPKEVTDFFVSLINAVVRYRESSEVESQRDLGRRRDFLQILIDIKNGYTIDDVRDQSILEYFDEIDLCANAFAFFGGGFETTASTIAYCLYELSFQQSIQEKVRQEVQDLKLSIADKLKLEHMNQLKYIDTVVAETLRKYPPVPAIFRTCTADFKIPGDCNVVLRKGTKIITPIQGLHMDPTYFPEPEKFDPERFSPENKSKIISCSYLPFGEGPRNCIGMRFAKLTVKYALAEIISRFLISPCAKTESPIQFLKGVPLLYPKHGIWVNLRKI